MVRSLLLLAFAATSPMLDLFMHLPDMTAVECVNSVNVCASLPTHCVI